jgi:hypothetical protein
MNFTLTRMQRVYVPQPILSQQERVPKMVGVVKTAEFFLPLRKNAARREDISSPIAKKQRDTAGESSLTLKRVGVVKTAEFFLPLKKNAAKREDISSPIAKKQRDTAGERNLTLKRVIVVKTAGFFLPLRKNAASMGDISSPIAKKQRNTAGENILSRAGAALIEKSSLPPGSSVLRREDAFSPPKKRPNHTVPGVLDK